MSVREIPLTQGLVALVDEADFERLNAYKWRAHYSASGDTYYAETGSWRSGTVETMHNMLLVPLPGFQVDHKDRNGLHNTRENLRLATRQQNTWNRRSKRKSPGLRGTEKHRQKWRATIRLGGMNLRLGSFDTETEAALAYDAAARAHFGEYAVLNFPDGAEKAGRLAGRTDR